MWGPRTLNADDDDDDYKQKKPLGKPIYPKQSYNYAHIHIHIIIDIQSINNDNFGLLT